jgi:hypothetical protein
MLSDSIANVLSERSIVRKLHGNACNEQYSIATVSTASREEEAGPKTLSIKTSASDSNRRLSCAG